MMIFLLALIMVLISLMWFVGTPNVTFGNNTPTNKVPTITDTVVPTDNTVGNTATTEVSAVQPTLSSSEMMQIKFYVHDSIKDPSIINCDSPSFVTRELPKSDAPLTITIQYLIHTFKLTDKEKAAGLVNYFEDSVYADRLNGFNLKSAVIEDFEATLTFEDTKFYTSAGNCRGGILASAINNTAKQFPTVTSVKYLPEDTLFQP
jgi:hypothetical protein